MSDFNKGDFTQQGVDGHVRATLRLNEKRYVELDLTTNENARGCTISGNVHDRLNNLDYPIGSAPSGNIEITENTAEGEPLDVSQYATATVNVAGGGGSSSEVVYVSGTFTPEYSAEAEAYIVMIETPTVIAQPMNNHFVLTVGNETKNVLAAEDNYQIPGAIYRLEPETPEERAELLGIMPTAIGSPIVIIAPGADPVFVELKQEVGTLDITISSDQTGSPLLYVVSQENGTTWSRTTAVYKPDFETHITIPYCGVKRAYISITSSFTYQNAVNCRVIDDISSQVIIIYDNNASIDLIFAAQ